MKVVYTDKPGREPGVCYRKLDQFFGVIGGAKEVVVDGEAPHIAEAYKAAGISVGPAPKAKKEADSPKTREGLDAALAALPGENDDPEYVVRSMKSFYGDLFTEEDEARVRELVIAPPKKPSDGLKVDEIKAKLTEKGITFDAGAKKPDLAKLLDDAAE